MAIAGPAVTIEAQIHMKGDVVAQDLRIRSARAVLLLCGGLLTFGAGLAVAEEATPDPVAERGRAYAHLGRAFFSIRAGEYGAALEEIHGAVAARPESPDLLIQAAELLSMMHREGEAERFARRALTQDPGHGEAKLFLADIGFERASRAQNDDKSRREAIRLYLEWLGSLDDGEVADPVVLKKLAQLQLLDRDFQGAVTTAERLRADRPGDREAAMLLTELRLRQGEREQGLRTLLSFVGAHPWEEDLVQWAGELLEEFGGWEVVEEAFADHLPFPPHRTSILLFYAQALDRTGRDDRASEILEQALEARPEDTMIRRSLVFAYRKQGRMAASIRMIEGLIDESPDEPLYLVWLADTLENQGNGEAAIDAYRRAIERLDRAADTAQQRDSFRYQIATIRLVEERFEDVEETLARFEAPESLKAQEIRARLAIGRAEWAAARKAIAAMKDVGEEEAAGLIGILAGEVAVGERRWSEAQKRFRGVLDRFSPAIRSRIAEIYRQGGREKVGEEWLREWVEEQPDDAEARYRLGAFLYELERTDEAEELMRQAFRIDPEHAPAMNFLGYSLAERRERLDEALDLVTRALDLDAWNGAYLDSLGWVFYQMDRFEEARAPLERAAAELPTDPTILEHLGDVYSRLGERTLALGSWEKALGRDSENADEIRRKMEAERRLLASDGEPRDARPR